MAFTKFVEETIRAYVHRNRAVKRKMRHLKESATEQEFQVKTKSILTVEARW